MIIDRSRFLISRVLPLAVVGLGVVALVPSDFQAAARTIQQAAPVAPAAPARVQASMPNPTLIATASPVATATALPQAQSVPDSSLSTSAGARVLPADATSDGVGTVLPDGLRNGRVGGSDVNVRADAAAGSAVLFTLPAGTALRLGETQGGWVHIYADTRSGWVYSSLLGNGSGTTAQIRPTESQSRPLSGAFRLRNATAVYDRPGGSRIYVLDGGERVSIAQTGGGWARIITDTDESGWIRI
jgi:SH3 domain-containing protein